MAWQSRRPLCVPDGNQLPRCRGANRFVTHPALPRLTFVVARRAFPEQKDRDGHIDYQMFVRFQTVENLNGTVCLFNILSSGDDLGFWK
jgi:hypothetical protein